MNMPKPDTFVLVVAALSEKLVQKENECFELKAHISADHAEMDEMQRTITDLRTQAESRYDELDELRVSNSNLSQDKWRLENRVYDLEGRVRNSDYLNAEVTRLKEELLTLKYGNGSPDERARTYMEREGARLWQEGNKILCIKGVRECTGWGLKESKDYSEANGPTVEPAPKTKPSEDLARKSA